MVQHNYGRGGFKSWGVVDVYIELEKIVQKTTTEKKWGPCNTKDGICGS